MSRLNLRWAVLPLLLLLAVEAGFRFVRPPQQWYSAARATVEQHPDGPLYCFIGSSITAAAIDPQVMKELLAASGKVEPQVLNLGRGFSTIQQHYLGLRGLLNARATWPDGLVVFVEAPGDTVLPATWQDDWVMHNYTANLEPLLEPQDLARLWNSGTIFETKLSMSVSVGMQWSHFYRNRAQARDFFWGRGTDLSTRLLGPIAPRESQARPKLTSAGGIRTDEEGMKSTRKLAHDSVEEQLQKQQKSLSPSLNSQVWLDLMRLVESKHGKLVFWEPPMPEMLWRPFFTEVRRADQEEFAKILSSENRELLRVPFSLSESDFPDGWHLAQARSSDYTRALFGAYQGTK